MEMINILIEKDIKDKLARRGIKFSVEGRKFFEALANSTDDLMNIDIQMLRAELSNINSSMASMSSRASEIEKILIKYDQDQKNKEMQVMQEEKDRLKKQTHCYQCGRGAERWSIQHELGNICRGCFLSGGTKVAEIIKATQEAR